jgi:hypothetical protein
MTWAQQLKRVFAIEIETCRRHRRGHRRCSDPHSFLLGARSIL